MIFDFVALLAKGKLTFEEHAKTNIKNMICWRTPFDISVVLQYSSRLKYNSEKIVKNFDKLFLGKDYSRV